MSPTAVLVDLISRSRSSNEPKKRLASIHWARALFLWSPLVIETLIILAGLRKLILNVALSVTLSLQENLIF
jgi:hypothetical protein